MARREPTQRREEIIWNGVRFYRYPDSRNKGASTYFTASPVRLHRAVWELHNGPVPDGYHVHHLDRDTANNDISNLELVRGSDHIASHWTPEKRAAQAERMRTLVQPAARAWHSTPAGREWHRARPPRFKPEQRHCLICAAEFTAKVFHHKYCSAECRMKRNKRVRQEAAAQGVSRNP